MVNPESINGLNEYLGGVSSYQSIRDGVNESYKIKTVNGDSYFLKIGTNPNSRLETEIWVMKKVQDEVPVPEIYLSGRTDDGHKYFLSEYTDAEQGKYPTEIQDEKFLFTEIGKQLANLHQTSAGIQFGILPPETNKLYDRWEDFYREWIRYTCEDAKKNYPSVASQLIRLIHWCDISQPDTYVINPIDFHTRNIFHIDNQIELLIDLERCFGGHRAWSYATTRELLSHSVVKDAGSRFERGYRSVRDIPGVDPCYEIAGLARSMRAAHMIWSDESKQQKAFQEKTDKIEDKIS